MNFLRLQKEGGFTILEVVFAVSILSIGIMGYTTLKSSSRYSRTYSKQLTQSIELTSGQMEDFWLRGYKSSLLLATAGTAHDYSEISANPLELDDFTLDSAQWTVRDKCPSELAKLINLTSTWNASAAKPKTLTITQVQVRP